MSESLTLGKKGEDLAAGHLKGKGYRILHRNWKSGKKEIDIVAENDMLRITSMGRVKNSGAEGDFVTVQNLSSQKDIQAHVVDAGTVKVEF